MPSEIWLIWPKSMFRFNSLTIFINFSTIYKQERGAMRYEFMGIGNFVKAIHAVIF